MIPAVAFPLTLAAFTACAMLRLLEGGDWPWWMWAATAASGLLAALSGRSLLRAPVAGTPGRRLVRRVLFAASLTAGAGGVLLVAANRGGHLLETSGPEYREASERTAAILERELEGLRRERPGSTRLEATERHLAWTRERLAEMDTAWPRVVGCGVVAGLFVLGALAAWVLALWGYWVAPSAHWRGGEPGRAGRPSGATPTTEADGTAGPGRAGG